MMMNEHRRGNRIKTEGDKLSSQLQREKSIFKNLSWQVKQKDRKIIFLQRYHRQLQQLVKKEHQQDSTLLQKAQCYLKSRKKYYAYHSNILQYTRSPSSRKKMITQLSKPIPKSMGSQSAFLSKNVQERVNTKK